MKTTDRKEFDFRKGITIYSNHEGKEAWKEGDQIYHAVLNQEYLSSAPTLMSFVKIALSCLDENNLVNLLPGENMPVDAKVGIIYQPSYAVAALAIYLKTTTPKQETAWMNSSLKKLLDAAFQHGIVGHGFEAGEMFRNTMLMFCRAGLKEYLESGENLSEVFNQFMRTMLEQINNEISVGHTDFASGYSSRCPHLTRIPAEYLKMDIPVFVYGTLMKGERASALLEKAYYAGEAVLRDYAFFDLGHYPGIKEHKGNFVLGQVFYINAEIQKSLDDYEGEGALYHRTEVNVLLGDESIKVAAYVYASNPSGQPQSGRWNLQNDDPVWYACYGSNLSENRFACYIRGGICEQNKRRYAGCTNKTIWTDTKIQEMPGRMYFAKHSSAWSDKGVAFYLPETYGRTVMKLYKITYGQLKEVQQQEGSSLSWYGHMVCLGFDTGLPIMTFTSENRQEQNEPDEAYLTLIHDALINECGLKKSVAERYLKDCLKPFPKEKRRRQD